MPDRPDLAPQDAVSALLRELEKARELHRAQTELEEALRRGLQADRLRPFVEKVEAAAQEAAEAAMGRRRWFNGPGSLERSLEGRNDPEARELRRLSREARELRESIHRSARRCGYVAGRSVEWTRAQMQALVQWVTRDGTTYGGSQDRTRRPAPSIMDAQA